MKSSLEKRSARCVKTNAPIRCKECVTKNIEINRLQQVCSIQSLQIVRLQREIALLGLQRSPSRDMVDASVGTDIVLFDSDKPKTCDSNTQSPTMLLTRTDVCCGTDDDLPFNLACTPDLGQVVLTVPSPLKREDSFLLGVGGRSTLGTAGSWSRHSQPHCGGSTVSGCSSRCRMFFLHLLAGMHVCRLGTPSL